MLSVTRSIVVLSVAAVAMLAAAAVAETCPSYWFVGDANRLIGDPLRGTDEIYINSADGTYRTPANIKNGVPVVIGQVPGQIESLRAGGAGYVGINVAQPCDVSGVPADGRGALVNPIAPLPTTYGAPGRVWGVRAGVAVQWQTVQDGASQVLSPLGTVSGQAYRVTPATLFSVAFGTNPAGAATIVTPADIGGAPGSAVGDGIADFLPWVRNLSNPGQLITGYGIKAWDGAMIDGYLAADPDAFGVGVTPAQVHSALTARVDVWCGGNLFDPGAGVFDARNFNHNGGTYAKPGDELNDAVDGSLLLTGELANIQIQNFWSAQILLDVNGTPVLSNGQFVAVPGTVRRTIKAQGDIRWDGGSLFGSLANANGVFSVNWNEIPFTNVDTATNGTHAVVTAYDFVGDAITSYDASATFELARCKLEVTKTCVPSYKRTWDWSIDKECVAVGNPPLPLNLSSGQTYPIDVAIKVCEKGHTDSDFAVSGKITVTNPCSDTAVIEGISDIVSGDIAATVTECDGSPAVFPYTLAAGQSHEWCYSATLPDKSTRTNTATVTTAATSPVDGGRAACTVDFTDVPPADEIDECVTVSDQHCIKTPVTICVGDSDLTNGCKEFTCQVTVTCDDAPAFEDTATLTTNDTQKTSTATCSVPIAPCGEGCSLTWGYWKTHAIPDCGNSGNPHPDATWLKLPGGLGSLTMFFLSGQTYCDVLLTAPQGGNAYYILAHQYIAAQLNQLAGTSMPADVLDAFKKATVLFQTYTPADLNKKSSTASKLRAMFIGYAGLLASYNEGLVGPGHCDEALLPGMSANATPATVVTLEDPAAAGLPADVGGPDTDLSGSVDISDFLHFQECFGGSNRVAAPGCADADFDGDSDVDMMDFTVLQACFNGPNRLVRCGA